jgi:hypothetical protein
MVPFIDVGLFKIECISIFRKQILPFYDFMFKKLE